MKKAVLLFAVVCTLCVTQNSFAQEVALKSSIPDEQKPEMIVVSANYGLILGYSFFIEHRGSKRTGNKQIYKTFEDELIRMGNPSDAVLFMENSGYDLLEVYSFVKDEDITTINYVYKKR